MYNFLTIRSNGNIWSEKCVILVKLQQVPLSLSLYIYIYINLLHVHTNLQIGLYSVHTNWINLWVFLQWIRKRENLQSGPGVKKAFYATNDVPPRHISIDLTIHSCTHKYNSIKHKILKRLSDLRSSKASHLLVPPNFHPTAGAAAHISQELAPSHQFLPVSQGLSFETQFIFPLFVKCLSS